MDGQDPMGKVSAAPTRPAAAAAAEARRGFDVAELFRGPVEAGTGAAPGAAPGAATDAAPGAATDAAPAAEAPLDEKLRQAYFWIVNHAIISPFYDIEYNAAPPLLYAFGDAKVPLSLPSEQSYSSYILLPLLTLALRRRCLLVGGPGRGKTAIAVLMGVLAGYGMKDIKRGIQHGQPQMTITDLLGNPLPSSMVQAASFADIRIAWRSWLSMRVKIIDEYNRIPTRTQSALLTVLGDNYAEMYDQIYECPEAAWYLTANDDAGGGTYQVIEALRDRIDVVVKALHFNTRFLGELLERIESGARPEEMVPEAIVFRDEELDRAEREIRAVAVPDPVLRRLEFFAGHFEFFEPAARQLEYMTKDTVKLAGVETGSLSAEDTGRDRVADLGSQTRNGLSVRALMTCLAYLKGIAWFRGSREASLEDARQIVPFVLHDKLVQEPDCPFFEQPGQSALRTDRVSWLRNLFDLSCREYDRLDRDRQDEARRMLEEFGTGLEGLDQRRTRERMEAIERTLREWSGERKLYGHVFDDILALKYLHQRYANYLRWLQWKG